MKSFYEILIKKRDGFEIDSEDIEFFVREFVKGRIPEYQVSAFLMAVYFNGLSERETFDLTKSMMMSGDVYDLSVFGKKCVDKHSTGGVGDKVSLICGPIAASLGVKVPMMCGRGLGHTGGTVDKLESIPGFGLGLSKKRFFSVLKRVGLVFSSQTEKIAPADKKLYALRDVTGTVENLSLITSSIMSKKLATGAPSIVFDVKTGKGAFLQSEKESIALARALIKTAKLFKRKAVAVITDMNEPLGCCVGNMLEVVESIEALKGNGAKDLMEVSLAVSGWMLVLSGVAKNIREGVFLAKKQIENSRALSKFRELVKAQGGDVSIFDDTKRVFKTSRFVVDIKAGKKGVISELHARKIGDFCTYIGAGRQRLDDKIDYASGVVFFKKVGDKVSNDDVIARVYFERKEMADYLDILADAVKISGRYNGKAGKKVLGVVR